MNRILLIATLICGNAIAAKDISIQDRILRLEQLTAGNQNKAEIVFELEKLQQQIDELRGSIEEFDYKIKNLTEKQQLLYTDIDSRLGTLENAKQQPENTNQDQVVESSHPTIPEIESTTQKEEPAQENNTQVLEPPVESQIVEDSIEIEQNDYDVAFSHLRAGRFNESARQFETFMQNHPNSKLTDNAFYWLGESYYVQRQYPQALSAFQELVNKYPQSRKLSDAMLKVGYTYFELDDIANAEKHLQNVIKSFPNTSVARLAKNRLGQIQRGN